MYPTPTASSYGTNQGGAAGRVGKIRPGLETMARKGLWPTPTASVANGGMRDLDKTKNGLNLHQMAKTYPTPCARDFRSPDRSEEGRARREAQGITPSLPEVVGGQLNPTWVAWLMGWPLAATKLPPSETTKYRSARPRRGKSSEAPE